jgi:undecaprenyl-diphosphatase
LGLLLAVATVPAVVAGVLVQPYAETVFRSTQLVAINLIWVGILMLVVDRLVGERSGLAGIRLPQALVIGFAQAAALVPGVSRSGATITAGRALGLDRVSATRFSFLLSAPVITGATLKLVLQDSTLRDMATAPLLYVAGIAAAFVAGYLAIRFMLSYLSRHGLAPFAIYRIVVGVLIIVTGSA